MGFLGRFRRKKKKGPRSQGEPPPELLQALRSLPHQAVQRLMSVRSEQELIELLAEYPELKLVIEQMAVLEKAVKAFVNANTWVESKLVVETHPELLTDAACNLLEQLVAEAERHNDKDVHRILEEHRQILARCRIEGIEAAFKDKFPSMGMVPEDVDPALLMRLMSVRSKQDLMQLLTRHPELAPIWERMMQQLSSPALFPSAPTQTKGGLQGELSQAPLEVQRIIGQLSQPVRDPRQWGNRIQLSQRGLALVKRELFPFLWAMLQFSLADALFEEKTMASGWAENQEQAVVAYKAALEVITHVNFPMQWAMIQNNLGGVYRNRIRGDRADNMEQTIAAYQAALKVFTRVDFPIPWANTQNNLGNAYGSRIQGDRAENLERAIAAHTAALEVRTRADLPVDWAETQHNLGNAYVERIRRDRAENLEQAIAACTAALEVRKQNDFPVQWAKTQVGLGNALRERVRGGRSQNLEQAITAYTAALKVCTQADFPVEWAGIQNNLGEAYRNRTQGDRAENLEKAIIAYTAALEVRTQTSFTMDWAVTQNNLGNAYASRTKGNRSENLERAISAYQTAIDGAQEIGVRDYERIAASNLGNLHNDEGQWAPAYTAFDTAIAALEDMRIWYFSEAAKARLAEENAQLYTRMVDTCLRLDRPQEALERAEAGKGRLFLDQLGTDAFPAPPLSPDQPSLLQRETELLNDLRNLEHAIRNTSDENRRLQFVAQQEERRAALDEIWAQLEPHAPDYVALRRGNPVKYDDLQAMVDGFGTAAVLVEFYALPDKVIAFVLRSGEQEPAVVQVPMSQDQLLRHVQNYWREVVEYPRRGDIGQRWQELAGPLLAEVLPHLQGAELVYLVPHSLLHYLPLHALRVDGGHLIDRFPIAYAPSAAVLGRVVQRTTRMKGASDEREALVVGNPTLDLRHAESEARKVAQLFGTQPYLGKKATKATIQSELTGKNVVHLACHGYFHPTQPLQSGVVFAGEESLTAQEIMGLSLQADLVTLSACTTGLSEVGGGDELVGLTRALLYAGASSALVSLWAVGDESTGQLMTDFYRRLYDDTGRKVKAEAVALREAMLEIRKTKAHPYYWAPFILVGDWW